MDFARIRLVFIAFLACVVAGGSATAAEGATIGHVYPAMDTAAANADYSKTASRSSYVILQAWETKRMQTLKAANPALKVLVYKNLAFSNESTPSGASTGVSSNEAPDSWFLKNTRDQRFTSDSYNWLWAMDVGSSQYQQKWAENVIAELEAKGWDGVFMDDCNATMKYAYDPSQVAKYPDDSSYGAAMESAISSIGPKIQARGKLVIGNFAAWVEYPETYNRWLGYVSGALDEMFVKWGNNSGEGYRDTWQWEDQVAEAKYAAATGKVFLAFTHGAKGETQAARFGYASVLLGGDGNASYAFTPDYTSEAWMPEYEYELGSPVGAETADSNGVHRRRFENGLVLVNPTGSTKSVSFGGTYSGSGLTDAASATMQPHSGLVLTGTAIPKPKPELEPIRSIDVTVIVGKNEVGLTWHPGKKSKAKSYKIVRNSRSVAKTTRRHRVERGVAKGRLYRFRIVGYDRYGKVVAKSSMMKVRGSDGRKQVVIQRSSRRA